VNTLGFLFSLLVFVSLDKEYDHLVQVSDNCSKAGTNTEPIIILDIDEETDFKDPKANNSINDDLKGTSARDLSTSLIVLANQLPSTIQFFRGIYSMVRFKGTLEEL